MSEDYYKARIGELERELEAAHAELGQYGADIKMLERRLGQEEANRADYNYLNMDEEQKLWELYRDSRKQFYLQGNENGVQGGSDTNKDALDNAQEALKVWEARSEASSRKERK